MSRTITGGATIVATITSAVTLIGSDDPLLITTGAEGAMGTIVGAGFGIYGDTTQAWTITNFGTVEGTAGHGIRLRGGGAVTNGGTANSSASIYGYSNGLDIGVGFGYAAGGLGFATNFGTIVGANGRGVRLEFGGTLTNSGTAALISGGSDGVQASRLATVTNEGTIRGYGGGDSAVNLSRGGTFTNSGTAALVAGTYGGVHAFGGYDTLTVFNDGSITGANGIAVRSDSGGSVTNGSGTNTAAFMGGDYAGVNITGGAGTIVNDGTITATRVSSGSHGVGFVGGMLTNGSATNTDALISAPTYGIQAGSTNPFETIFGAAIIVNDGTVMASDASGRGVLMLQAGTVTNGSTSNTIARIEGGAYGVFAIANTTVINDGIIVGTNAFGVLLGYGGGTITNGSPGNTAAEITGASGAAIYGAGGVLSNEGTITGLSSYGALVSGHVTNGSTTNTDALISGSNAVQVTGTVTNFARISGTTNGVVLDGNGIVENLGTAAQIHGVYEGVTSVGYSIVTVVNDGSITALNGTGIFLGGGGSVTNGGTANSAALINGYYNGVLADYAAGTVVNYGTIIASASSGKAVFLTKGGDVSNLGAAALISGYQTGVKTSVAGTVTNEGTIRALDLYGTGINAGDGGTVINSGTVSAYRAVSMLAAGAVVNAGTTALITGRGVGVYANHAATDVTNEGSILGTGPFGAGIVLLTGGTISNQGTASYIRGADGGIFMFQGGSVANGGAIVGGAIGVKADAGRVKITNGSASNTTARIEGGDVGAYLRAAGVITNFGTITGSSGGVVVLGRRGIINNRGLIAGAAVGGVYLGRGGVLTNTGTITGFIGVEVDRGATTLTNRGTIIGTGGTAVDLAGADDTVAITRIAVFSGVVKAGLGTDTLALLPGGVGTISGLGTAFAGFEVLSIDAPAAKWMMSGTNTLPDGALIDGAGRLTITGTLTAPGTLNIATTGTIGVAGTGMIEIGSTGGALPGKINIDTDGTLSGHGILRGAVVDNGLVSIAGGALTTLNSVTGTGTIEITANALLNAGGPLFVSNLVFAGAGTDESLIAAAAVKSTISGFDNNDAIDLTSFLAVPGLSSFVANKLILDDGAGGLFKLNFAPGYTIADFDIAPDGFGGTIIVHHL